MTTDGAASSDRAIVRVYRALWPRVRTSAWPRLALISLFVVIAVAWTGYVAFRLRATYAMETQQAQQQVQLNSLLEKYKADQEALDKRIAELEQTLYGSIEPGLQQQAAAAKAAPRRPSTPELWQRNRDAELRKMLTDMQRRVLRLENQLR
jgi:cell division protein FtsB